MSIDVLYVAHNRLAYTEETFAALVENTDWSLVRWLVVMDDGSTDGTREFLRSEIEKVDVENSWFDPTPFGGPVSAMNRYLAEPLDRKSDLFAKVDNDFVMPPGWLNDLHDVMSRFPELAIIGTEPMMGLEPRAAQDGALQRVYTPCEWIGGKGLLRRSAFKEPMDANGRLGFTSWQHQHPDVMKGWITPDILSFGLDQLPFEPWQSLMREYVAKGWQREWPPYDPGATAYWSWWKALS